MNPLLPKTLDLTSEIQLEYLGPSLDLGPLPAVWYFALSAKDSLGLDPYNQPATYLSQFPLRVFSISLPYHKEDQIASEALAKWAKVMHKKEPLLEDHIEKIQQAIHLLLQRKILIPNKIAAMGLSRGAFIAAHTAAVNPEILYWLGFAPLTKLSYLPEFSGITDWDLVHVIAPLSEKIVRCYIGNRDTRVGTRNCFDLITSLVESAYKKRYSSPPIELLISPSIGRHGHGTKKETFHHGARWLAKQLQVVL